MEEEQIVGRYKRAFGIRDVAVQKSRRELERVVRQAIAGAVRDAARATGRRREELKPAICLASGMITSELGLCEVPHLEAPAGLDDLARGAVTCRLSAFAELLLLFIPGVKTAPLKASARAAEESDFMRGEETQIMGLLAQGRVRGPFLAVILGSHAKFALVDAEGRICRSFSTLSGELIRAVATQTVLSSSLPRRMPADRPPSPELIQEGVRLVRETGFTRTPFVIRLLDRLSALSPEQCFDLLAGAVAAEDVKALQASGLLRGELRRILVAGNSHRREAFRAVLAASGAAAAPVEVVGEEELEEATVRGALSVLERIKERFPEKIAGGG